MIEDPKIEESYNADDRESVNKARKKAARQKILEKQVIQNLMSTKDGRAWIYHILTMGDMFGNPFVSDPYSSFFNGGMANMARLIWIEVEEAAPESCLLMRKEARSNDVEQ